MSEVTVARIVLWECYGDLEAAIAYCGRFDSPDYAAAAGLLRARLAELPVCQGCGKRGCKCPGNVQAFGYADQWTAEEILKREG